MKKILLLLLFIPLVSFGQQFSINELIEMSTDIKLYERKMFSMGNQMTNKESEVWYDYYDSTEPRLPNGKIKSRYSCSGETIIEAKEECPRSKDPKYKFLKRESNYVSFAENYNSKKEEAHTFYTYSNRLRYEDTGFDLEEFGQNIKVLYIREDDFYAATKYLANNKRFEYSETSMEKYYGLVTYYRVVSQSNSEFRYSIRHYEDDREGIGGSIVISSNKNNL
tara:strand:+ start:333 stop:1001 length:669 start_codon:yes stop_codon:yes gene_type:complete